MHRLKRQKVCISHTIMNWKQVRTKEENDGDLRKAQIYSFITDVSERTPWLILRTDASVVD